MASLILHSMRLHVELLSLAILFLGMTPCAVHGQKRGGSDRVQLWESIAAQIKAGDLQAARARLERVRQGRPEEPKVYFYLGWTDTAASNWGEAVLNYRRALARDPLYVDAWTGVGIALESLGRKDEALTAFTKVLEIAPTHVESLVARGRLYLDQEKPDQARADLERAVQLQPRHAVARAYMGTALTLLGEFASAEGQLKRAVQLDNKSLEAYLGLATLYSNMGGKDAAALENLKKARDLSPHNIQVLHLLGTTLMRVGRLDEAEMTLQEAAKADASSPDAHYLLATVYQRLGRGEDAQKERELFAALDAKRRKFKETRLANAALFREGQGLLQKNLLAEAAQKFHAILETDPGSDAALGMLAKIDISAGSLQSAEEYLARAMKINPLNAEYPYLLALCHSQRARSDSALSLASRAVLLKEDFADAHNLIGTLYQSMGRIADAVAAFRKATQQDADEAVYHLNLATALKKAGRIRESQDEMKIYKKLSSGAPQEPRP